MLILRFHLNLIIPLKSIHKRKYFASHALVKNLFNERSQEVMFSRSLVQVLKIHTYMDSFFLFIYKNMVRHPFSQGSKVDETNIKYLLYLCLNSRGLPRINISANTLPNMLNIWIGFNLMFDNIGVNPWHLFIRPSEYIMKLFEEIGVDLNFFRKTIYTDIYVLNFYRNMRDVDHDGVTHPRWGIKIFAFLKGQILHPWFLIWKVGEPVRPPGQGSPILEPNDSLRP
jgi:hypothetical protein